MTLTRTPLDVPDAGGLHPREAALVLEDGATFIGTPFGAEVDADAEVVFNTGVTGYEEIATDPSYRGQMVVLTHPQIGNYGISPEWRESVRPWVAGLIVRELAKRPHHWAGVDTLEGYLVASGVPGLQGVDTRALVRHLRERGTLRGVIRRAGPGGFTPADLAELKQAATRAPYVSQRDLVSDASAILPPTEQVGGRGTVTVLDCGAKWNIVRSLERRGVNLNVLPWNASAEQILAGKPSAIVVSNGPGDPADLNPVVETLSSVMTSGTPILGICLGHQLLARAAGGTTSRLRYGHHGGNHPVLESATGLVTITTQNHEFQVDRESIVAASGFEVSHVNLNDGSVEGLRHRELPVWSVQYHPEGCPGPQDSQPLFDEFLALAHVQTMRA